MAVMKWCNPEREREREHERIVTNQLLLYLQAISEPMFVKTTRTDWGEEVGMCVCARTTRLL
jgi:hypothetical protein